MFWPEDLVKAIKRKKVYRLLQNVLEQIADEPFVSEELPKSLCRFDKEFLEPIKQELLNQENKESRYIEKYQYEVKDNGRNEADGKPGVAKAGRKTPRNGKADRKARSGRAKSGKVPATGSGGGPKTATGDPGRGPEDNNG